MVKDSLILASLIFAIFNAGSLAVIFWLLSNGRTIVPDNVNGIEFVLASGVTVVSVIALAIYVKTYLKADE